jgi:hypothetical protein
MSALLKTDFLRSVLTKRRELFSLFDDKASFEEDSACQSGSTGRNEAGTWNDDTRNLGWLARQC